MIKQLKNFIEEPTLAFVVDNSQSINPDNLVQKLKESETKLTDAGFEVEWGSLNESNIKLGDIKFNSNTTNLSKTIKEVENNFINRNLFKKKIIKSFADTEY